MNTRFIAYDDANYFTGGDPVADGGMIQVLNAVSIN